MKYIDYVQLNLSRSLPIMLKTFSKLCPVKWQAFLKQ